MVTEKARNMHTQPSISAETMELTLASVSDCEVRSAIQFLRVRDETVAEIRHQISAVYGKEVDGVSLGRKFRRRKNQSSGCGILPKFGR